MAMPKPSKIPAKIEDIILRKIFLVSLVDSMEKNSHVTYLEVTAMEMMKEGKELKLLRESMESVLIDRLSGSFPTAEPPFQYLVNSYRRTYEEGKKIASMKDKNVRSEMELVVKQTKKLAVTYCRVHLCNPDCFPNYDTNKLSATPWLPLIFVEVGGNLDGFGGSSSGASFTPGFLEKFFRDDDYQSIEPAMTQLYEDLRGSVLKVSALGNFQPGFE